MPKIWGGTVPDRRFWGGERQRKNDEGVERRITWSGVVNFAVPPLFH